jgi:hypothetical protein
MCLSKSCEIFPWDFTTFATDIFSWALWRYKHITIVIWPSSWVTPVLWMFSRSVIDDSWSVIDDSRSVIDDSRSVIDDSRSQTDSSRVTVQIVVLFTIIGHWIDDSRSVIDDSMIKTDSSRVTLQIVVLFTIIGPWIRISSRLCSSLFSQHFLPSHLYP